jgi:hypothetical protein
MSAKECRNQWCGRGTGHDCNDVNDSQSKSHRKAATFSAAKDNRMGGHHGDATRNDRYDRYLEQLTTTT